MAETIPLLRVSASLARMPPAVRACCRLFLCRGGVGAINNTPRKVNATNMGWRGRGGGEGGAIQTTPRKEKRSVHGREGGEEAG